MFAGRFGLVWTCWLVFVMLLRVSGLPLCYWFVGASCEFVVG